MKLLHIYIIRCTLLVAMLFAVSWAHAQNEEIFAVEQGQTITPNQPITATRSVTITPGLDKEWPTDMSMGSAWVNPLEFTASIYYPSSTTTYTFVNSMRGTNNPKDGALQDDGTNAGNGYKYNTQNLPVTGGFLVFEALQSGSLIVPIRVFANKPLYVTDGNGKVKTDIQFKDASGTTYTLLTTTLCAVSETDDVTGFVSFNVTQGEKYYVFCTGSKARFGGCVFSTESITIDPATMADVLPIINIQPYARLENDELTFMFDANQTDRDFTIKTSNNPEDCPWYQAASTIKSVKFTEAFLEFAPISTAFWFYGMQQLDTLNLSNLTMSKVTNANGMFMNCSSLKTITVNNTWPAQDGTNITGSDMFNGCRSLKGGAGTAYDGQHIDYTYAHIDGGTSNPGYFTAATEEQPSTDESNLYPAKNIVWRDITWKNANNKKDKDNNDMPFLMGSGLGYKTLLAESVYREEQGTNVTRPYYTYIDHEAGEKGVPGVGLYYKFTPKVSGQLRFNTWVNKGNRKTFIIKASDGTPLEPYVDYTFDGYLNGQNQPETGYPLYFTADEIKSRHDESGTVNKYVVVTGQAFWGWITVNLNGGESYYIYQPSSQLGFGGYDFTPVGGTTENYVSCIRSSNNDGTFVLSPEFAAVVDENGRAMNVDEKGSFVKFGTTNMDVEALGSAEVESVEADFDKPYAVLSDNNTVLTFYYDDQKEARGGMDVGPFNIPGDRGWESAAASVTTVLFDQSMANCTSLTSTAHWFYGFQALTTITGIANLNTTNVTTTYGMFAQTGLETLDLRNFDTHNVKDMNFMFAESTKLSTIYVGNSWSTANVEVGDSIFDSCPSLVGGQGTVFNPDNISVEYAHVDGGENNPGYLTEVNNIAEHYAVLSDNNTVLTFYYDGQKTARNGMDIGPFAYLEHGFGEGQRPWHDQRESITSVVIDASMAADTALVSTGWWFYGCTNLKSVNGWDNLPSKKIVDMWGTFEYCSSLPNDPAAGGPDFSKFNSASLKRTCYMFHGCTSMTSLDLSTFNTTHVTENEGMFQDCTALTAIYVGNGWDMTNATDNWVDNMFLDCTSLVGGAGTTYDANHVGSEYARVDGGPSKPGYLTGLNISTEPTFDYNGVLTVRGSSTMDEALRTVGNEEEVIKNISSIVWNSSVELTENDLTRFNNPNMLIYTNDRNRLDENRPNVIINGNARNVVLTDTIFANGKTVNGNFYCPQEFTAAHISFIHSYKQRTEIGVSRGWETLVLPFNVQDITHERNGEIAPFGKEGSDKHFWLRQVEANGLARATQIEANIPYFISMPNNPSYGDAFNQAGVVAFSAENTVVPKTELYTKDLSIGDTLRLMVIPVFQRKTVDSSVYALNVGTPLNNYPEGSVFVAGSRDVNPFEVCTFHEGGHSPAPLYLPLLDLEGSTTGIAELRTDPVRQEGYWYDLNGRRLSNAPTGKGIYIFNGKKVVR